MKANDVLMVRGEFYDEDGEMSLDCVLCRVEADDTIASVWDKLRAISKGEPESISVWPATVV